MGLETGREGKEDYTGLLLNFRLGFINGVLGNLDELFLGFEGKKRWKVY